MDDLAPVEHDAPARLTQDQAQQLVLRTVTTHAESLLRTAHRHSLCDDDAHDAYQRGLEIFVRRARTLDPERASRWLHVVVKREAWAVRQGRADVVASDDFDFDRHEAVHLASPEEQTLSADRVTRAAEALQRLKPHEVQAMWLKALGNSYDDIGAATGWSKRKIERCLVEGRKAFLERFSGIEAGDECRRWQPVLSAILDGEATAAQLAEARPHLRNCSGCRASLRALHDADRPLAAVLPFGLTGAGLKLGGLFDRFLPAAASGDGAGAAGGLSLFGAGGAKLAGLLAAGAAASAGGGLVAVHEHGATDRAPSVRATHRAAADARTPAPDITRPAAGVVRAPGGRSDGGGRHDARLVARRASPGRVEFAPAGAEPSPGGSETPSPTPSAVAAVPVKRTASPVPRGAPTAPAQTDSAAGEFAPQP
jgi:hypothetical protein